MSQIYNDNTKRPKPKENQLRILEFSTKEFMHFAGNSPEGLGSRKSIAGTMYLSLRIRPKSCYIFPLKVATTLLSDSGKGAVGDSNHIVKVGVEATC